MSPFYFKVVTALKYVSFYFKVVTALKYISFLLQRSDSPDIPTIYNSTAFPLIVQQHPRDPTSTITTPTPIRMKGDSL